MNTYYCVVRIDIRRRRVARYPQYVGVLMQERAVNMQLGR